MKASDARAMTVDQLDDEVLKLKKEQFNLRFQRATGQLENTSRVRVGAPRHRAHDDDRAAEARGRLSRRRKPRRRAKPARAAVKRTAKPRPPVSNPVPKPRLASRAKAKSRK